MTAATLDQQLVYAAMAGDFKRVKRYLADGASPLYVDADKGSALMQACRRGMIKIARRLLDAGADPNVKMEGVGLSATDYAREGGHQAIVDLCCERGGIAPPKSEASPSGGAWPSLPVSTNPLCNLLRPFEVNCVIGCCGMDAFDFSPEGVAAVSARGVGLRWIRETALWAIELLEKSDEPVFAFNDGNEIFLGREDIHLLQTILESVSEVERRGSE